MQIDTHAHAFPELELLASNLPAPMRTGIAATTTALKAILGNPYLRLRNPLFDIEKLARFRSRGPRILHQMSEMTRGLYEQF